MALGPDAQGQTSSTCFSSASQRQSRSSSSWAPGMGCCSSGTWDRDPGRTESGRAAHGLLHPRMLLSRPTAPPAAPGDGDMNFPICKPRTCLSPCSLLNFSWALISTDPRGDTLATSPRPAPSSPVLQPILFTCSRWSSGCVHIPEWNSEVAHAQEKVTSPPN